MDTTPHLPNTSANQQWGGRFTAGLSVIMQEINASIGFDRKLWRQDFSDSLVHAAMLAKEGVIGGANEATIRAGRTEHDGRWHKFGAAGQSWQRRQESDGAG